MLERQFRPVIIGILIFIIVIIIGSIGYVYIEGAGVIDAIYMTVITITTVGFGEIFPLSQAGRLFTIGLVITGAGTVAYTASHVIEFIIAGEIRKSFRRKKMDKKISKLKDHYIICGFGRMGKVIAKKLKYKKIDFVIIDKKEKLLTEMEEKDYLYITGDGSRESILIQAGVLDAKGLITVVNSDAENVYIILTAKGFNKDLYVISRSSSEEASVKMFWAGSDKTVSPYDIGGGAIADSILKPHVSHFFELAMGHTDLNIEVDEIIIDDKSIFLNKKIKESNIRNAGIIVIAIKKCDGTFRFNPGPDELIEGGDTLIALGRENDFQSLDL